MELSPISTSDEPLSTTSTKEDYIYKWNTEILHQTFGIGKWEDSQLYLVFKELGLLNSKNTISGGCIVRHLMNTEIFKGDIDIWPVSIGFKEDLISSYTGMGYKLEDGKFSKSFDFKMGIRKTRVQLVVTNCGSMNHVLNKFDYEHVKFAFRGGEFYSTLAAPASLAARKLQLRYVKDPVYSLIRALKYKRLGFDADEAISKLTFMIKQDQKEVDATGLTGLKLVEY